MSEELFEDLVRERDEWLTSMGRTEGDVMMDQERDLEFIMSESEDEDGRHFTKVYIPFTHQKLYQRYYKNK